MLEKYIKDDKVAVLITKDYGTGWFTNHYELDLIFDKYLVEQVLRGEDIRQYLNVFYKHVNDKYQYYNWSHVPDLEVVWVPVGTKFIITEYDGMESIWPEQHITWLEA